ncbi:MAG: MBL fold metallo-hydrolase [Ardenticatenaceae bacterium]|nr:MBL fold metallo-hydrolase [Ardenticatenaceae bacterium]
MKIVQLPLGPIQTNCYIVGDEVTKQAAVIDPAFDGHTIARQVKEMGFELTHILITHAHFDHVGGLAELMAVHPEAPVYIHEDAVPMLAQSAHQARMFGMNVETPPEPQERTNEGDQIQVGELVFDVLYTPGHAPGHVSFLLNEGKVIFSGDVLFQGSIGRTDLPGGSMPLLLKVIDEKLLTLPDETRVLSGHGPATTIGQERLSNPFLR